MITAIASAMHGHNTMSKGIIVAGHVSIYSLIGFVIFGFWGLSLGATALIWWGVLRRSRQENIENDYMHQGGHGPATLMDVMKAHYFTGLFTVIALRFYNYGTSRGQKLGWEHQAIIHPNNLWNGKKVRVVHGPRVHPDDRPFMDCRRPTEIATGLTGDCIIATHATYLGSLLALLGLS